jgi:hypothetical protein
MAQREAEAKFDAEGYLRDKPIGWLPEGTKGPDGKLVEQKVGKALTVGDLSDEDKNVLADKVEEFRAFIHPRAEVSWISIHTMGAPYNENDPMKKLQALAIAKSQEVENLLDQLVVTQYATDLYNKALREVKPTTDKAPDRTKSSMLKIMIAAYPTWETMSEADKGKAMVEFLASK